MGKRIWLIAFALALGLLVYVGSNRYDAKRAGVFGDVFNTDRERLGSAQSSSDRRTTNVSYILSVGPAGQAAPPAAPASLT